MKVREVCSDHVRWVEPTDSVAHAAKVMAQYDIGALPVIKDGGVVGIVTDRDLVLRGLAAGLSPHAPVRRVMTADVIGCSLLDELSDALEIMSIKRVRRLPVYTNGGELVGMITLADAASVPSRKREAADALAEICSSVEVPCQVPMFC